MINRWNTPYLFNAKELDEETGLYYYGARYYDPRISLWLGTDPLQEKYPDISTYAYCANNSIRYTDPTGMWVADENGNLVAEKNDNAWTLAKYQNITPKEAIAQLKGQGYTINDKGILNLKVGDMVTLDNVFTQSIANSTSDLTLDAAISRTSTTGATPEDYYNCWGSAIAGSQGQDIKVGVGIGKGETFDNILQNQYMPTNASDAKFGTTVLRFANGTNDVQHGTIPHGLVAPKPFF